MKLITKGTVARIGAKINKPVAKIATPHSSTPITFNQRGKLCVLKVAGKRSIPAKEFKPKPAGAEIRESLRSRPLFKRFIQLGRDTSSCRVLGIKSLVKRSCSTWISEYSGNNQNETTSKW